MLVSGTMIDEANLYRGTVHPGPQGHALAQHPCCQYHYGLLDPKNRGIGGI